MRWLDKLAPSLAMDLRRFRAHRKYQLQRRMLTETGYGFTLRAAGVQGGRFEVEEMAFALEQLSQCDTFIDVGANIGLYTCLARAQGVRAIALEPSTRNVELLLSNLLDNGFADDCVVLPMAAGSANGGILSLYNEGTGASLVAGWGGLQPIVAQHVPMTRLDSVIMGWCAPGDRLFIKMDVEGAELEALLGAGALLARQPRPVWLVEVNLSAHHPGGRHPAFFEVFRMFWHAGYSAADPTGRPVEEQDVLRWLATGVQDFGEGGNYVFR